MEIRIGNNRLIGDGHPVFIIAEVGNNHQGRLELAVECIDIAAQAGADAVTFQYAPIDTICIHSMYNEPGFAFLKECEFSLEQLKLLRDRVKSRGMAFSVNVEDKETLDKMIKLGIDFIKLCSADLTNIPYIRHAAQKGLPIFFSTGGAFLGEIERAFAEITDAGLTEFVVYHTNCGYPTAISEANILQMDLLHELFGGVKGYCDHTADLIPPVVAAARFAKVIEKHITTNRTLRGDDWMVSLEPQEFELMVRYIRQAESALGTRLKRPLPFEMNTRHTKRKSIVLKAPLACGEILSESNLAYKSPGTGIPPTEAYRLVGKRVTRDVPADILLMPEMIDGFGFS